MQHDPLWEKVDRLVRALEPFTSSEATRGRISADLKDLIETSRWLLTAMAEVEKSIGSPDELEVFLIDLEVAYLDHTRWHIASLKRELRAALKAFPPGE